MANPWEIEWTQGDPVIAPPDPYKQRADVRAERTADRGDAQFDYQIKRDRMEDERKAKEDMDKATQAQAARGDAVSMLSRTLEKIRTVKTDVNDSWTGVAGLGETGMSGAMQGGIPGSPAYSLRKDLGTIDSTQVLQAMTRLKELSPTGSTGFGALSAPELELLKSSVARLDPNMDQATFMANLETAEKVYQEMLDRIEGEGKVGADLITEALRSGKSREEILGIAASNNLSVDEAALDANLRSRNAGGPVNKALPPDIAAIMAKYGAQ